MFKYSLWLIVALLPASAWAYLDYERESLQKTEKSLSVDLSQKCSRNMKFIAKEFTDFDDMLELEKSKNIFWQCRFLAEQVIKACAENLEDNSIKLKGIDAIVCRRASLGKRKLEVMSGELRWYADVTSVGYKLDEQEEIKSQLKIRFDFVGEKPKKSQGDLIRQSQQAQQNQTQEKIKKTQTWFNEEMIKIQSSQQEPMVKAKAMEKLAEDFKKRLENDQK